MGFLDFFKSKKNIDNISNNTSNFNSQPNSTTFNQMVEEMQKEREKFEIIFNSIHPIIKYGNDINKTYVIDGQEIELPNNSLPVILDINFDNLSLIFGINKGSHYEWLQNKDIKEAIEMGITNEVLIKKSFENLLEDINNNGGIEITMLGEKIGMLTNCKGMESSFILEKTIWDEIKNNLNTNEVLFGIPVQDVFIFCDKNSSQAIKMLIDQVAKLSDNPMMEKKISKNIYLRNANNSFEIFIP